MNFIEMIVNCFLSKKQRKIKHKDQKESVNEKDKTEMIHLLLMANEESH